MTLLDDIFYYSCCFIVVLHSLSALLVITHGRCTVYAAAFLIASAMWVSLSVLNLWFFLPTVVQDAAELIRSYQQAAPHPADSSSGSANCIWQTLVLLRTVAFSSAASYFYMMLFGWFVGAMSLSNALTMWQREGCDAMEPHTHSRPLAVWVLRAADRVERWVAIPDTQHLPQWAEGESANEKTDAITISTMMTTEDREEEARQVRRGGCFIFAVPRRLHSCYMLLLAPQVKMLGSARTSEKEQVLYPAI
ncbi:vacuolar protein sorting-associated protein 33 [Apiospora arundinis]